MVALLFAAGGGAYASTNIGSATVTGWAAVSAKGEVTRSSGGVSAFILKNKMGKTFKGDYQVNFTAPVSRCSYQASLTNPSGDIGVATRKGTSDAVYVRTVNRKGYGADKAFFVEVMC